jgi:hypothetical protein
MLQQVSSPAVDSDPMLLFTQTLGYRATVHLSDSVQQVSWRTLAGSPVRPAAAESGCNDGAVGGRVPPDGHPRSRRDRPPGKGSPLAESVQGAPVLPDTLACTATFFSTRSPDPTGGEGVQHLLRVLSELRDTHSLARDYLQGLSVQTQDEDHRQEDTRWYCT